MVSCIIKSKGSLLIEVTDRFADNDLNSIFLFLESLIDDYSHTKVYFKIEATIKKQVNQKLENNIRLKPYQILYLSKNNQKIAS
ncbi:hypothetical protein [Kordia sp.]|uniref:hypothetical protein n=1 Tax=Kordia sp. TaxID=1965332 RepID=UPI003B5979C0